MGYQHAAEAETGTAAADGWFSRSGLANRLRTLRFGKQPTHANEIRDFDELPRLRLGDRHPDAPARRPIFADSDFGAPLELRDADIADSAAIAAAPEAPVQHDPEPDAPSAATGRSAGRYDRADIARTQAEWHRLALAVDAPSTNAAPDVSARIPVQEEAGDRRPLDSLSLAELLDRFEQGLSRRATEQRMLAADDAATGQDAEHVMRAYRSTDDDEIAMVPAPDPIGEPNAADDREPAVAVRPMTPRFADPAHLSPDMREAEPIEIARPVDQPAAMAVNPPDDDAAGRTAAAAEPAANENDMDAALRAALATLKQLSDRQRNAQ